MADETTASVAPNPVSLTAGPLSMVFDGGDLRCLTAGGHEVARRIYAAVRDHNWETVPGIISELSLRVGVTAFEIEYLSTHCRGQIDFV